MSRDNEQLSEKYLEIAGILREESERGCVIVSAAILDEQLVEMIRARLVPSPEREDELLEAGNAPASSFSARIDLAYRIGVLSLDQRQSLHILRKLRNDFAHVSTPISFSDDSVSDRIRNLLELNRDLMHAIWSDVKPERAKKMPHSLDEHHDPLTEFVRTVSSRIVFQSWAASTTAAFFQWGRSSERLVTIVGSATA